MALFCDVCSGEKFFKEAERFQTERVNGWGSKAIKHMSIKKEKCILKYLLFHNMFDYWT